MSQIIHYLVNCYHASIKVFNNNNNYTQSLTLSTHHQDHSMNRCTSFPFPSSIPSFSPQHFASLHTSQEFPHYSLPMEFHIRREFPWTHNLESILRSSNHHLHPHRRIPCHPLLQRTSAADSIKAPRFSPPSPTKQPTSTGSRSSSTPQSWASASTIQPQRAPDPGPVSSSRWPDSAPPKTHASY